MQHNETKTENKKSPFTGLQVVFILFWFCQFCESILGNVK